jgi:hypothetical protein
VSGPQRVKMEVIIDRPVKFHFGLDYKCIYRFTVNACCVLNIMNMVAVGNLEDTLDSIQEVEHCASEICAQKEFTRLYIF